MKLNDLLPAALSAALKTGTDSWGTWASAEHHALYVEALPKARKRWRMCRCGCRKRATFAVKANGIALASGCQMQAHRAMRDLARFRR